MPAQIQMVKHLCTCVGIALGLLASAPLPAEAQQFLGYGRGNCSSEVTINNSTPNRLIVGSLDFKVTKVPSNRVAWRCGNGPDQFYECPKTTNLVKIDRRSGGSNFTIHCMRR